MTLQACETISGGERRVPDPARIVEYRGSNRAAKIDVKPAPLAGGIGGGKPFDALAHTAAERSSLLDGGQGLGDGGVRREDECRERQQADNAFHDPTSRLTAVGNQRVLAGACAAGAPKKKLAISEEDTHGT
jgi:hypothetical protein